MGEAGHGRGAGAGRRQAMIAGGRLGPDTHAGEVAIVTGAGGGIGFEAVLPAGQVRNAIAGLASRTTSAVRS